MIEVITAILGLAVAILKVVGLLLSKKKKKDEQSFIILVQGKKKHRANGAFPYQSIKEQAVYRLLPLLLYEIANDLSTFL